MKSGKIAGVYSFSFEGKRPSDVPLTVSTLLDVIAREYPNVPLDKMIIYPSVTQGSHMLILSEAKKSG